MRQKRTLLGRIFAVVFIFLVSSARSETRDCPVGQPDLGAPPFKVVTCPKDKGSAEIRAQKGPGTIEGKDEHFEDTYLYCGGHLQTNVFGGSLFQPICWKTEGAQATVWYKVVTLQ